MHTKLSQTQMIKYIKIFSYITMGIFMIIQFLLIVGVLFSIVKKQAFEI